MDQTFRQLLSKVDHVKYAVGSSYLVDVTHINHPKSFYSRLAIFKEDVKILEERGVPLMIADVRIGKRVIYKSPTLEKFVRGDIEFIIFCDGSFVCNIFAIDYGCREKQVPQSVIYLPKNDIPCRPLALHCQLYLCEPREAEFDQRALDAMRLFVGSHTAKITIVAKRFGKIVVELKTMECPDDVSTMLGLLHYTTICDGDEELEQFANSVDGSNIVKYKYAELEVGDKLNVRVQSGLSVDGFYVAEVNEYRDKLREAQQFVEYCKRQQAEDVPAAAADGRSCGVKVNETFIYERAIVKRITVPDTKAVVKLVDWGKEIEVDFSDIKKVKTDMFTKRPAVALYCSSSEDQLWNNGFPEFFRTGWTLIIEITELGDGVDVPHKVNMISNLPEE